MAGTRDQGEQRAGLGREAGLMSTPITDFSRRSERG